MTARKGVLAPGGGHCGMRYPYDARYASCPEDGAGARSVPSAEAVSRWSATPRGERQSRPKARWTRLISWLPNTRVSQATSSVDTEVLSGLRVLQTELTGAGIPEPLLRADDTTDVLVTAPDAVWGARRKRFAPHLDSVRRQCGCTQVGAAPTCCATPPRPRRSRRSRLLTDLGTGQLTVRLHVVLPPIAASGLLATMVPARCAPEHFPRQAGCGGDPARAWGLLPCVAWQFVLEPSPWGICPVRPRQRHFRCCRGRRR